MKIEKLAQYSIFLSVIPGIYFAFFPGKIVLITILACYPLILLLLSYLSRKSIDLDCKRYVTLFNVYGLMVLFRGMISAANYKDWTTLASDNIPLYLFVQFTIFFGAINSTLFVSFKWFLWFILPLSIILVFRNQDNLGFTDFSHTVSPIYLLIICIPFLNKRNVLLVISISIFSFISDISDRSNLVNIGIAFLITSTYYLRNNILMLPFLKGLRKVLLIAPIVLLILGTLGIFNIFQAGDLLGDYTIENNSGKSQDLLVDSRTPIYVDVFNQLKKDDAIIWGLGANGKTATSLTNLALQDGITDFADVYKDGRPGTESGMLNFIQWGGAIGGILYFLLFWKGSEVAINNSKNWLCVMLSIWLAYKAIFSFVEDTLFFSPYSIFTLIAIGMCLNKKLKQMSNEDVVIFFKDIAL
jgi:hypothetical protein